MKIPFYSPSLPLGERLGERVFKLILFNFFKLPLLSFQDILSQGERRSFAHIEFLFT